MKDPEQVHDWGVEIFIEGNEPTGYHEKSGGSGKWEVRKSRIMWEKRNKGAHPVPPFPAS